MPVVTVPEAGLAANTKSSELLSGSQIGYAPKSGMLRVFARASAIGLNLTVTVGSEVVMDDQEITSIKAAGSSLVDPDDLAISVGVAKGEQIRAFVRNSTAGAITRALRFELL